MIQLLKYVTVVGIKGKNELYFSDDDVKIKATWNDSKDSARVEAWELASPF